MMQITVSKKKIVYSIFLLTIIILTGIFIVILSEKNSTNIDLSSDLKLQYPCSFDYNNLSPSVISPETNYIASVDNIWSMHLIQPVIKEYRQEDNLNLIIGEIKTQTGLCNEVKIITSGAIPLQDNSGLLDDFELLTIDNKEKLSYLEFKTNNKVGNQIGFYYIADFPTKKERINIFCEEDQYIQVFCDLELIADLYHKPSPNKVDSNTLPEVIFSNTVSKLLVSS